MKIIIVGCGRVGSELAGRLFQRGHQVAVIDYSAASFANLPIAYNGRTIEGEALNRDVLHRAGIEQADGLAAVTNNDSINAVIAHVARTYFNIPHVFVRNYDTRWRPMHEAFGHQIVSSSSWGAQRIEELLYHADIRTIFSAGNGEIEIYEFSIPLSWKGRALGELVNGVDCLPVALARAGRASIPTHETVLEEDDVVNVSATVDGIETVRQRLNAVQEA
jgi:trk system potassium uptake protein TrkA